MRGQVNFSKKLFVALAAFLSLLVNMGQLGSHLQDFMLAHRGRMMLWLSLLTLSCDSSGKSQFLLIGPGVGHRHSAGNGCY